MQAVLSVCLCKALCIPSKAAILIIIWTATIGTLYNFLLDIAVAVTYANTQAGINVSMFDSLTYAILAIIMIFYPFSGFIADVYCGRLRTVFISTCLLFCYVILTCLMGLIIILCLPDYDLLKYKGISSLVTSFPGVMVLLLFTLSLVAFVIGLTGYQANFIQLGLDQLFEAPSHHLSLFIHYATWSFHIGAVVISVLISLNWCVRMKGQRIAFISIAILFSLLLILFILLLVGYCKYRWFSTNTEHYNPYKTVCKVLNFARKNKYPIRRSAFTYSDKYIPSRLDFAKERFGGPFPTEKVENVKTFLRILTTLFAIGPVFMLEVPASFFVFPVFTLHTIHYYNLSNVWRKFPLCDDKHIWETLTVYGTMMAVFSNLIWFPIYLWIVFRLFHNRMPRTFTRLGFGIVVCLLGVTSLLTIDVVGHALSTDRHANQTRCMFQIAVTYNDHHTALNYPTLNLHWAVLIVPSLLLEIGPLLTVTTVLEFISAQSPQSMKGLLVGVFFAIRGLFQFLNSIVIIPLSLKHPWASGEMLENPPVTNCGFVYLLFTCVAGLVGLILFLAAAKKYKYRERNEGLFCQQDVEEIYDRYISQAAADIDQFMDDYSD